METATTIAATATDTNPVRLTIGMAVIVRCRDAGVHFGDYQGHTGREVTLTNSRRLWRWFASAGVSLNGVADFGIVREKSKIDPPVANVTLLEACEIIVASDVAATDIREAPIATRD